MTTLSEFAAEFKSRGYKPINTPVVVPVGKNWLVLADDGRGHALLLFRSRNVRDEFLRVPWDALNKAQVTS